MRLSVLRLKPLLILITLLFLGKECSADAVEVLMVTENAAAPYMMELNNKAEGIYPRIIREADRRITEYDISIETMPWKRALRLVEKGDAHGIIGTYYKPNERPWIKHFSTPYFVEDVTVFCRNGVANESWVYPYDFAGLKFGNNRGYETPGPDFFHMVKMGRIKLEEANDTETNLRKLMSSRIDCYVNDAVQVEVEASLKKLSGFRKVSVFRSETSHVGFSRAWVTGHSEDFISRFDDAITNMHDDGTIQEIYRKFLAEVLN